MPDRFFSVPSKKRKSNSTSSARPASSSKKARPAANGKGKSRDEELSDDDASSGAGSDRDGGFFDRDEVGSSGSEDEDETAQDKRVRLAKLYLEGLAGEQTGDYDAAEIDREIIAARLKKDVLEQSGKFHLLLASRLSLVSTVSVTRSHRLTPTSAIAVFPPSPAQPTVLSASKDGSIAQNSLATGKLLGRLPRRRRGETDAEGHDGEVVALAGSQCGRWVVSGGKDKLVGVWDTTGGETGEQMAKWVKGLAGFKDTVSALSFRLTTPPTLFAASLDRTLKLFSFPLSPPDPPAYVETLFGHQDHVLDVSALRAETAVSAGARDKTVRFWKVVDESQLVFRGGGRSKVREVLEGGGADDDEEAHEDAGRKKGKGKKKAERYVEGSIECVAMIDEVHFISGGDSGSLCLWNTSKKKPIFTFPLAHGTHTHVSETEGEILQPRWITSVACLPYADFFVSGSCDGHLRLWQLDAKLKSFSPLPYTVPAPGIVNSLQLLSPPKGVVDLAHWQSSPAAVAGNGADKPQAKPTDPEEVLLVAAVGQEPRLGRWMRLKGKEGRNAVVVAHFRARVEGEEADEVMES